MKDILGAMKEEVLYLKQDESVYGSLRSRLEKNKTQINQEK